MAMKYEDLVALAKNVAHAKKRAEVAYTFNGENFSYDNLQDTLRTELKVIAGTYALYRENRNTIYKLIEEVVDDVLPTKVLESFGRFAEIKQFAQGDKPVFTQRITTASKRRAKQFITKVGLAGIYEVFKLDGKSYEVPTSAFGGAAQIGFEEFLDGRVDFADVLDVLMEGLDECVYLEIERALRAAVVNLQTANKVSTNQFMEADMDRLIQIADSYGHSTIYCTYEFATTMVPAQGWISDSMKDQKWNKGYFANYKSHDVIILPQSYEDDTNTTKVIDPSYAWIIPNSANEKPVKVAFEGQTIVDEYVNKDRSREIQAYKKFGAAAMITNNICVYINTSLTR